MCYNCCFYWGTDKTPRRSSRIIEKAKAASLVEHESEPPKKRAKTSSADIANNEGKFFTVDGDLKTSKENIDDKGTEWYEVVHNKNEEIWQPVEERKVDGGSQEVEKSE